MKPAFHESYANPDADPIDGQPSYDFDYDAIDRLLSGVKKDAGKRNYSDLACALRVILCWLAGNHGQRTPYRRLRAIATRTVALIWVLDPAIFSAGSVSLRRLARYYGFHVNALSRDAIRASKFTGVINRHQHARDAVRQPISAPENARCRDCIYRHLSAEKGPS